VWQDLQKVEKLPSLGIFVQANLLRLMNKHRVIRLQFTSLKIVEPAIKFSFGSVEQTTSHLINT